MTRLPRSSFPLVAEAASCWVLLVYPLAGAAGVRGAAAAAAGAVGHDGAHPHGAVSRVHQRAAHPGRGGGEKSRVDAVVPSRGSAGTDCRQHPRRCSDGGEVRPS